MLLRCERHGVSLRTLWELGFEILLRSSGADKQKAEEFIGRVRLAASDIGRHPTTEKQVLMPSPMVNPLAECSFFGST
jgi:hypothetical protein